MADVLTVREAVKRARAENLPITEYSLRRWIRIGAVPVRTCGSKCLLYWPNLLSFVTCEAGADNTPASEAVSGIRRIGV